MDVGLNNRNMFEHPILKDVIFLVEATSTENHNLWKEWSWNYYASFSTHPLPVDEVEFQDKALLKKSFKHYSYLKNLHEKAKVQAKKIAEKNRYRVNWEQVYEGHWIEIGKIGNRPVAIEFSFAIIEGKKIAFYNGCSQVVDHKMIKKWLIERFQCTHDNYTRWNHV